MRIPQAIVALAIVIALASPAFADKGANSNSGNGSNGSTDASGSVTGSNGDAGSSRNDNASGRGRSGKTSNTDEVGAVPNDQEVARDAVRSKSALSLERITAIVRGDTDGRILDLQLVTLKGVYLYEVTVLETSGVLHKLYYNSRTGVRLRTN